MNTVTTEPVFSGTGQVIKCRAIYFGQRIELKQIRKTQYIATNPLAINYGHEGIVILFRYGAIVSFGLSALEENRLHDELSPYLRDPLTEIEEESLDIRVKENSDAFTEGSLCLNDLSVQRLQVVAGVLIRLDRRFQEFGGLDDGDGHASTSVRLHGAEGNVPVG